jgi:hypothetical protein
LREERAARGQRVGPIAPRDLKLAQQRMRIARDRLSEGLRNMKSSGLVNQEGGV